MEDVPLQSCRWDRLDGSLRRSDTLISAALWLADSKARPTPYVMVGRNGASDVADRGAYGFIGMETHFAILLAPDEADGKAATQFAASGFVANAAEQAATQDMVG